VTDASTLFDGSMEEKDKWFVLDDALLVGGGMGPLLLTLAEMRAEGFTVTVAELSEYIMRWPCRHAEEHGEDPEPDAPMGRAGSGATPAQAAQGPHSRTLAQAHRTAQADGGTPAPPIGRPIGRPIGPTSRRHRHSINQ
jgi:hypothetical protein